MQRQAYFSLVLYLVNITMSQKVQNIEHRTSKKRLLTKVTSNTYINDKAEIYMNSMLSLGIKRSRILKFKKTEMIKHI